MHEREDVIDISKIEAPEVSTEQGYIGLFVSMLRQRRDQIQAIVKPFPSRVDAFKEDLMVLEKNIKDFTQQISGVSKSKPE